MTPVFNAKPELVRGSSAFDVDCAVCGKYRNSRDRETRMLRKQFSRRTRALQLSEIRSANAKWPRIAQLSDCRESIDLRSGQYGQDSVRALVAAQVVRDSLTHPRHR